AVLGARGRTCAIAQSMPNSTRGVERSAGPTFTQGGPNAQRYGIDEGYPVPDGLAARQGNPWDPQYRVGAFSHLDALYPTRTIQSCRGAMAVQALAGGGALPLSRTAVVAGGLCGAQSGHRPPDRQGRPGAVRALSIW